MTENTPGSVHRRTVVAGAAWTIPVVATAIGAPLAAASGEVPTLAFTNGPYTVAACGTLKDVVLKATTDGTAPPVTGTLVTVTLPAGLTWSNGETGARAFPTDANGTAVVSGVRAASTAAGGVEITASASGVTASALVETIASAGVTQGYRNDGSRLTYGALPAGSRVLGWSTFITADGDLYYGNTLIATDVTSAAMSKGTTGDFISYISNGVAQGYRHDGSRENWGGFPAGTEAVGWATFLAPSGDLYYGNTLIAADVTSAAMSKGNGGDFISYISNGVAQGYRNDGSRENWGGFPAGTDAIGWAAFLTSGGGLYYGNTLIAADVTSAAMSKGNGDFISYITAPAC